MTVSIQQHSKNNISPVSMYPTYIYFITKMRYSHLSYIFYILLSDFHFYISKSN